MSCAADTTFLLTPVVAVPLAAVWGGMRARGTPFVWLSPFTWGSAAFLMGLLAGIFLGTVLPEEPCMDTMPYDGPPPLTDGQVAVNTAAFLGMGLMPPAFIAWMHATRNPAQLWLLGTVPLAYVGMVAGSLDPRGLSLAIWLVALFAWLACIPGWLEHLVRQATGQPSGT